MDDYKSMYTPCDEESQLKYVAYYKVNECSGGIDAPIANNSLPCSTYHLSSLYAKFF